MFEQVKYHMTHFFSHLAHTYARIYERSNALVITQCHVCWHKETRGVCEYQCASTSAIKVCLYGSHRLNSTVAVAAAAAAHSEWTSTQFPFFWNSVVLLIVPPTAIVQLINDFQNQYRLRIRTVRFYIFIHSLTHCLDILCARAQHRQTYDIHDRYFNALNKQTTAEAAAALFPHNNQIYHTVDFVTIDFTVTRFAIVLLLFLFFASSLYYYFFLIVYHSV